MRASCVGNVFYEISEEPPICGRVHSVFVRVVNFEISYKGLVT